MTSRKYSKWKFRAALGVGAAVAAVLCIQCVRTYFYIDSVLVPQQAEREAERQVGALTTAARSAGLTNLRALSPVIEHVLEASPDRVLWMRVLDLQSKVLAEGGKPEGTASVPAHWMERLEAHRTLGAVKETAQGPAFVTMIPFRLPHPPRFAEGHRELPQVSDGAPGNHRPAVYIIELAVPLKAAAGAFDGLRQNLIVGLIASVALLLSLAVISLRARHYVRGKYLESELQLARRVQNDLQPKPHSVSPLVDFAASAIAADHVGGDFHDVFEAEDGRIVIVLGDVSGKGVPAALLVSVLQGAIRSSTSFHHEYACERINRMLCERTACERFATLFWGVYDPADQTLRYVNAGHAAPMLLKGNQSGIIRLEEGGPVLGLLSEGRYSAGTVDLEGDDMLILYTDGINEASNAQDEEFGERRIEEIASRSLRETPENLCQRILGHVNGFANGQPPADDRTLLVVRFPRSGDMRQQRSSETVAVAAVA